MRDAFRQICFGGGGQRALVFGVRISRCHLPIHSFYYFAGGYMVQSNCTPFEVGGVNFGCSVWGRNRHLGGGGEGPKQKRGGQQQNGGAEHGEVLQSGHIGTVYPGLEDRGFRRAGCPCGTKMLIANDGASERVAELTRWKVFGNTACPGDSRSDIQRSWSSVPWTALADLEGGRSFR